MKLVRVVLGLFLVFAAGGVIYGFAALEPVLVRIGVFRERCPGHITGCAAQKLHLTLLYTVATTCMCFAVVAHGRLFDALGPRLDFAVAIAINTLGALLLGLTETWPFAIWLAFAFLGGAAPGIAMGISSLPKTFPAQLSTINALISSLFDVSAGVFYLMNLAFFHADLSLRSIAWFYGGTVLILGAVEVALLPSHRELALIQAQYSDWEARQPQAVQRGDIQSAPDESQTPLLQGRASLLAALNPQTFRESLRDTRFLFSMLFMSVLNLKNGFYIATFTQQADDVAHSSSAASALTTTFYIVFPFGGLLAVFVASWLLNTYRERDHAVFLFTLALCLVHATLNMIPVVATQYAAIAIFAVMRSLKWAAWNDFMQKRYRLEFFGSLFGLANVVVALSGLLIYFFSWLAYQQRASKNQYLLPNAILTAIELLCVAFPLTLYRWHVRRQASR